MTTLNSISPAVKSPRPMFGLGLAKPDRQRVDPSAASDAAWWSEVSNDSYTAELDRLAGESAALDAHEQGLSFA